LSSPCLCRRVWRLTRLACQRPLSCTYSQLPFLLPWPRKKRFLKFLKSVKLVVWIDDKKKARLSGNFELNCFEDSFQTSFKQSCFDRYSNEITFVVWVFCLNRLFTIGCYLPIKLNTTLLFWQALTEVALHLLSIKMLTFSKLIQFETSNWEKLYNISTKFQSLLSQNKKVFFIKTFE